MVKKFKALDSTNGSWLKFKIFADENGWELTHGFGKIGDYCKTTVEQNYKIAYENMLKYVDNQHLTNLVEDE